MKKYIKSARIPKQFEIYVSQEYVPGYGWEDITQYDDMSSESLREAKQDVKDYRDNGYNARVITRKVANPDYVEPTNDITYDDAVAWVEACPYSVKEIWSTNGKNYILRTDPKQFYGVQVFIDEDGTTRVRNISTNRTKSVYSIDELEKAVNKILQGIERPTSSVNLPNSHSNARKECAPPPEWARMAWPRLYQ